MFLESSMDIFLDYLLRFLILEKQELFKYKTIIIFYPNNFPVQQLKFTCAVCREEKNFPNAGFFFWDVQRVRSLLVYWKNNLQLFFFHHCNKPLKKFHCCWNVGIHPRFTAVNVFTWQFCTLFNQPKFFNYTIIKKNNFQKHLHYTTVELYLLTFFKNSVICFTLERESYPTSFWKIMSSFIATENVSKLVIFNKVGKSLNHWSTFPSAMLALSLLMMLIANSCLFLNFIYPSLGYW